MSLHGDLSTLDLTNLLQNLEGARKTGLLTVHDEDEETQLFFADGKLALIHYPSRASLVDYLVMSGAIAQEAIDEFRSRRRRARISCAALADAGAISSEDLGAIAKARLLDEACEILAAGASRFEFADGECPTDLFDPDERALGLALPASPLLLESARRSDHWALIREHLPSDSTRYSVAKPPRLPSDEAKAEFVNEVVSLVDGARTVREIVAQFPTHRFEVYQLLADLAKSQTIRPIPVADLNRRILELARRDKPRALALLERGLEQHPHHLALLCTKAVLAEKMGDLEQASEALKLVVHLQLENAEQEAARATLDRLKDLDDADPFAWEKSFELALADGRRKDALADGRALVELYRKPGLHRKVAAVLERLLRLQAPTWPLARELAHARADAGERDAAVKGLEQFAAAQIDVEAYPIACKAYEEIVAMQPTRKKAKEMLQDLKSGVLVQRKERWRRLRFRAILVVFAFGVLPWIAYEAFARRAYREAARSLVMDRLLETGRFAEARQRYADVREHYPWTTTAMFDVEPILSELDGRLPAPGKSEAVANPPAPKEAELGASPPASGQ
jgi:tetratricopeptide (TPR) repeat protein